MKVEADKTPLRTSKKSSTVTPTVPIVAKPSSIILAPDASSFLQKKIGVIYSDHDKECALRVMAELGAVRVESPEEIFNCKYVVWIASTDSLNDCCNLLDTAKLFTDKLLVFWWRAVAIESTIDATMMNVREIYESPFAFFPTNGTYIHCNTPAASFQESLFKLFLWIKHNKTPQGQKVKSQKFY